MAAGLHRTLERSPPGGWPSCHWLWCRAMVQDCHSRPSPDLIFHQNSVLHPQAAQWRPPWPKQSEQQVRATKRWERDVGPARSSVETCSAWRAQSTGHAHTALSPRYSGVLFIEKVGHERMGCTSSTQCHNEARTPPRLTEPRALLNAPPHFPPAHGWQ